MKLVIVESPAKAKTIEKYLGKEYRVLASVGHIRDLPKSNKDAVDIDAGFVPRYVIVPGKTDVINRIESAAEKADEILLATDPDREGEAIAWHLAEILAPTLRGSEGRGPDQSVGKKIKRITYQEITKNAIQEAIQNPRDIDQNLRRAQEARRVLDRLVGYDLSGLIWKKVRYGLSAGRVQSPALRIIAEREREIRAFKPEEFYVISADFKTPRGDEFTASCSVEPDNTKDAEKIVETGKKGAWKVADVSSSPVKRSPKPPFTTSTLQQTASSRLGFSPSRTMRIAQKLYEAGLITYMRTDSVTLAGQAMGAIAGFVKKTYGEKYLETRAYKTKSKNAQEAHEAIRPTDIGTSRLPVRGTQTGAGASEEEARLYELIRARTLASQMADAIMTRTKIIVTIQDLLKILSPIVTTKQAIRGPLSDTFPEFVATGSTIAFDGWLKADPAAKGEDVILPEAKTGEALKLGKIESEQKFTEPPPRYTEAGLVKELEKRGIGRPSTYASIIKTIVDRGYVVKEGRALQITSTGDVVSTFLENNFEKYISDSFTAEMEDELDQIASGERKYAETLHDFYVPFSKDVRSKENIEKLTNLGEAPKEFPCPICGASMVMKLGKTGVFMSCSRFPDCKGSRTETGEIIKDNEPIGVHPKTGLPIIVKTGRFGPYVEMKEANAEGTRNRHGTDTEGTRNRHGTDTEEKPRKRLVKKKKVAVRRASIPKDINPAEITLEQAVKLLSIPRELGAHPQTGEQITAAIGKFGPFIVHQGDFRSLKGDDNPYDITHERALEILQEPKKTRPGAPTVVRTVGAHPRTKKPILLYKSKSGFFLKKGFKRISVPEKEAETLTPAKAVDILKNS